ncbi:MAG: hypothetical protein KDD62_08990 [Bdellovibrionales bacterium]|nr:hypothetical protein [Bdellovibrionales bacterium]
MGEIEFALLKNEKSKSFLKNLFDSARLLLYLSNRMFIKGIFPMLDRLNHITVGDKEKARISSVERMLGLEFRTLIFSGAPEEVAILFSPH